MKHFPLLQKKHSFIFAGFHSNKKKQATREVCELDIQEKII
jgi:hypothetical protein